MDERSILMAQIQALLQELGRAEKALKTHETDSKVYKRVRNDLEMQIQKQRQSLENLRKVLYNNISLDICWSSFRSIYKECLRLRIFRECLAFQQGTLARKAGLDEGLCGIADALLDDLSERAGIDWQRFTIIADEESFTGMAQIIRLLFPQVDIWNLPTAVHEFGHFVAHELKERRPDGTYSYPFQLFLQKNSDINSNHLHEHFADLFATYTIGPAYACTCILLRFDPGEAYQYDSDKDHPNYAKRVYLILKALDKMNSVDNKRPYIGIFNELCNLWQRSLLSTKQQENLDPNITAQLNIWLEDMYMMLQNYLLQKKDIQYGGWSRAYTLSNKLLSDAVQLLNDEEYTLSDVLNAAWLFRLEPWKNEDVVEKANEKALNLCTLIIQRGISNGR